jgi:hypothetical protein
MACSRYMQSPVEQTASRPIKGNVATKRHMYRTATTPLAFIDQGPLAAPANPTNPAKTKASQSMPDITGRMRCAQQNSISGGPNIINATLRDVAIMANSILSPRTTAI